MADIAIDLTGEDGVLDVITPLGFDLQIFGCGLTIDITHEQGAVLYAALSGFFGEEAP